ncbi:MAG: DNA-directed RNA polymerase subunit beta [Acidobacteria bacterium]|uniref:DNA-directed RNA polymerase subunit beta n=1 Tax=Candidatus Polarisedimenticola svalbardensis TaxID=2886004 RepID=A0A8J6Y218_9BACT|nr:DNA-directed RNA polymerase subunit beta [Candidatus Polarisedimenticola svalbardensis]
MPETLRSISPKRSDSSKIKTAIPIPNLIEVQKRSYERFLQMHTAPADREASGLQAVFKSIFPIQDFRETCSLEFVDYTIGNWECKCGEMHGIEHLRSECTFCSTRLIAPDARGGEVICHACGNATPVTIEECDDCGEPVALKFKYTVDECQERGQTFTVPLKVTIQLVVYEKDPDTGARSIRDIKEQEVYFGEIPMLTDNGTFIVNGTERVIVSQLHRSPGVFFQADEVKSTYMAKMIPYRGSWVEFEYDHKDILYIRIDRKRKFPATVFMRALGLEDDMTMIRTFYSPLKVTVKGKECRAEPGKGLIGLRAMEDIMAPRKRKGDPIIKRRRRFDEAKVEELIEKGVKSVRLDPAELTDALIVSDVVDEETGEAIVESGQALSVDMQESLGGLDGITLDIVFPDKEEVGSTLISTLAKDPIKTKNDALLEIYRRLRPGDPPTLDSSKNLFHGMFFDPSRYDFSQVGRLKFNTKLYGYAVEEWPKAIREGWEANEDRTPSTDDFIAVLRYMLKLQNGGAELLDDIDHLGNRRVRSVGELLENQFRIGLVRMERAIKEKMSVYQEMTTAMPHDLINAKPVMAAIQEFFGSSQLSQFMDQTNPLSEVTHKRRLSALGPGGLSRERAGFEVRDVHPTHYGRICPIETPEGPNIGLISSLSCYARINEYGFIESPYRKVEDGKVVENVRVVSTGESDLKLHQVMTETEFKSECAKLKKKRKILPTSSPHSFYLTAWEEDRVVIAQANATLSETGEFVNQRVNARKAQEFKLLPREDVAFIDVSPKQLVSVAASLIPFLENDDANRALMGSNMQRQAVPLIRPQAPLVGTGMEAITAQDSGAVVVCKRAGVVDLVDSERIIVRVGAEGKEDFGADIYSLTKFKRSNQNTCINQRPLVRKGQRVGRGHVLADGPCTENGELALGRNVLVAFMPWRGYNFEDAILVSENMVREDSYTSIHIEEFEVEARDTKLGPEEITRDIPNVSEEFLKDLDEAGVIRIGAHVKPGDIIVGKVTPKGESLLTPEEKLLRAIFGEKSGDVRDASLTASPGIKGTIVDVKIFCRKGVEKDSRAIEIENHEIERMQKDLQDQIRIIREEDRKMLVDLLEGEKLVAPLVGRRAREIILEEGTILTLEVMSSIDTDDLRLCEIKPKKTSKVKDMHRIEDRTRKRIDVLKKIHEDKIAQMQKGDELAPGVIKMVKVFVAMKRKLSVGDKMAGRHGNKGVIARLLPEEDMPWLPDGTPVQVVLNPLGVPSRMNVGQILETHLGWAGHEHGKWIQNALAAERAEAATAIRGRLKEIMNVKHHEYLDGLSDDGVIDLAGTMESGVNFATPVFDGISEVEIKSQLELAGLPTSGKIRLRDGHTGIPFEQLVTVGYIYLLKLSHLVDDKIHARSIGPYSLITQQPLGGKAQFGGQRFGEMEVWALEAYGAAHILQELLTVKSDDVYGRTKIYESLVKGDSAVEPGLPESFNVLVRELQSLCLDVELLSGDPDSPGPSSI